MHHAIEETPVQMGLRMAGRTVRRVAQLRIALHHPREDVTLDHHETGRGFVNLDEAIGIRIAAHAAPAMADRIERIFGEAVLEFLLRHAGRQAFGRPAIALHRIDARGDVAIGAQ